MFIYYNANPAGKLVGDCVIRALSVVFNDTWRHIYADLTMMGYFSYDMPNANAVMAEYLLLNGFYQRDIPGTCPSCYSIADFAYEHPYGTYVLATGSHVVAVVNGHYFDTANSGNEIPIYYFEKGATHGWL